MDVQYDHVKLIEMLRALNWKKMESNVNPNIQLWCPTKDSPKNSYLRPFESYSIVVPLSADAPDYQIILKRSMFSLAEYTIDPFEALLKNYGE